MSDSSDSIVRQLPMNEYYERLAVPFTEKYGRMKVSSFGDYDSEISSLYEGVALRDISTEGIIELKGNDVLDLLNRISTNSVRDLGKEDIKETIFTSEKGRIIDVARLANFGSHQLLFTSGVHEQKVLKWIQKYIISDDVTAAGIHGKYSVFELSGPQADSFTTLVCGSIANEIGLNKLRILDSEGMVFFLMKVPDPFNEVKFIFMAEPNNGRKLIEFMRSNSGAFNFNMVGEEAYESYRLERGMLSAPEEINDDINPNEANLLGLVDFKKGCYIGQEVIARLDTYQKVQKTITGLKFESDLEPGTEYKLKAADGSDAGIITSFGRSPKCRKMIGLAYVRKAYTQEGTTLHAVSSKGSIEAVTHNLPFRK